MKCCNNQKNMKIDIIHNPMLLTSDENLFKSLSFLLWYSPEVKTSRQSLTNPIIHNPIYEDIVLEYIYKGLGISKQEVNFYESESIPEKILSKFVKKFDKENNPEFLDNCLNCQKIYLADKRDNSKPVKLLMHIRNILAHGNFNIINGMIFGYDKYPGTKKINTIIKIKPQKLYAVLCMVNPKNHVGITLEKILILSFKELGYKIIDNLQENILYDIAIKKRKIIYYIDLKYISNFRMINNFISKDTTIKNKYRTKKIIKFIELKGETVFPNELSSEIKIEEKENNVYIYPGMLSELYKGVDIIKEYGLEKYGNIEKEMFCKNV